MGAAPAVRLLALTLALTFALIGASAAFVAAAGVFSASLVGFSFAVGVGVLDGVSTVLPRVGTFPSFPVLPPAIWALFLELPEAKLLRFFLLRFLLR